MSNLATYSFDTRAISFATTSCKPMTFGSPIIVLARLAYSVPPSVQIRRKVNTVADGFPASQAAASSSRSFSRDVRDTSHG